MSTQERKDLLRQSLEQRLTIVNGLMSEEPGQNRELSTWWHMKRGLINRLNRALSELDREDYGKCYECEKEIEIERLLEDFMVIRCSVCQTLHRELRHLL